MCVFKLLSKFIARLFNAYYAYKPYKHQCIVKEMIAFKERIAGRTK